MGGGLYEGGKEAVAIEVCTQKHRKQYAQGEEQQIGGQEGESIATHILLSITQRLAGQVFLHHILIQSCHNYYDEHTT